MVKLVLSSTNQSSGPLRIQGSSSKRPICRFVCLPLEAVAFDDTEAASKARLGMIKFSLFKVTFVFNIGRYSHLGTVWTHTQTMFMNWLGRVHFNPPLVMTPTE